MSGFARVIRRAADEAARKLRELEKHPMRNGKVWMDPATEKPIPLVDLSTKFYFVDMRK